MHRIKWIFTLLSIWVISLFINGCASQKTWVYTPNMYSEMPSSQEKTAVVLPFEDVRQNVNDNYVMMYMIPLVPYGWQSLNVPENLQIHMTSGLWTNYRPSEDYPKALAQELTSAKIFSEAYFDFKKGDSDFVVKGKILSTKYDGTIVSYGLSVFGPTLWFFGFPSGTVSNELSVELSLVDSKSNETIFSNTYTSPKYKKLGWLYVMPNDFNYPAMLQSVYKIFIEDLRKHYSNRS